MYFSCLCLSRLPIVLLALSVLNLVGLATWGGNFSLLVQTIEILLSSFALDIHDFSLVTTSIKLLNTCIALVSVMTALTLAASFMIAYLPRRFLHSSLHLVIMSFLWLLWLATDVFLFVVCGGFSVWLATTVAANFAIWSIKQITSEFVLKAINILQVLNITGDLPVEEIEDEIEARVQRASGIISKALQASVGSVVGLVFLSLGCICILCSISWDLSRLWATRHNQTGGDDRWRSKKGIEMQAVKEGPEDEAKAIITVIALPLGAGREEETSQPSDHEQTALLATKDKGGDNSSHV